MGVAVEVAGGIDVDTSGVIYLANYNNNNKIQKIGSNGELLWVFPMLVWYNLIVVICQAFWWTLSQKRQD